MDRFRAIFKPWFFDVFIPKVKSYLREKSLTQKAVLLLDNASSHSSSDSLQSSDSSIFLPAKYQGVLDNLKRQYKRALLERVLLSLESVLPQEFMKGLDVRDCIYMYMCAKAW